MATVTKVIDVCDRCPVGKEKPATADRMYATDPETWWLLKLCEPHAQLYDRDIGVWTRLSAEIDPPAANGRVKSEYFTAERKREAQRIAELRSKVAQQNASREFAERRAAEIEKQASVAADAQIYRSIPGALGWTWTTHAHERMAERGFNDEQVMRTAAQPDHTYSQEWRAPGRWIYQRGDCRIAVDIRTKTILTVIDRSDTLDTNPPHGADQKVQVAQ